MRLRDTDCNKQRNKKQKEKTKDKRQETKSHDTYRLDKGIK
jgi:hypothetical protein